VSTELRRSRLAHDGDDTPARGDRVRGNIEDATTFVIETTQVAWLEGGCRAGSEARYCRINGRGHAL
jgi:hypothetical protein